MARSGYLIRDLTNPCQPTVTYAQKPRTETEEKTCSSERAKEAVWPAPGSEDTELGVLMELEVGHGETEVYARVQA